MPSGRPLALFLAAIFSVLPEAAIAQDAPHPKFESVSLKQAAPDEKGMYVRTSADGTVHVINMHLEQMIVLAWHTEPFQIYGGPQWLATAHYDIAAKPAKNAKPSDIPLMLQSLLADRFQLKMHRETRELPIYALVVANRNAKLGPGLAQSKEGGCAPPDPSKPPHPPEPGKPSTLGCGGMMIGRNRLAAASIPIADLGPMLSRVTGRMIVDKTGLAGKFDVSLQWTPAESQQPPDGSKVLPGASVSSSLIAAIEEQLGLKLESRNGPVKVFVIDRAEKPAEN